ncbi:MAG: dipeptidyl aminopeptidase/acylaminoacyl peptidase [Flavobacteriales bacterium]|jgi:dipeptidyl aminopeptidase/acylaminoacyl peptidase
MTKSIFILFLLACTFSVQSQKLQLEEIMKGDNFIGNQPSNQRWSIDGQKIYFDWNPKNEIGSSTYFVDKNNKKPQLAAPKEAAFSKLNFLMKPNSNLAYYVNKGALYSYAIKEKVTKKLIQQSSAVSNLQLAYEDGVLFFEQNDNLIKFNTRNGTLVQLSNFKEGKVAKEEPETQSFLKTQQKELFLFIRDQEASKKWYKEKSDEVKSDFPKEYFYGKNDIQGIKANPNGNFLTFNAVEPQEIKSEKMEVFITSDGYNKSPDTKRKVSVDNLTPIKFGVYSIIKDSVYYMNFSKLSHLKDTPEYYKLYDNLKDKEKTERPIYVQEPTYNDNGSLAVTEIRSQDNKDRWMVKLNLTEGTFEELDYQHDDAWIGGPGIPSYTYSEGTLGFLVDNSTIYYQSEATGYSHLYTYNLNTKKKQQLTSGNWEVRDVILAKDKKTFYLTTTTTHPGNRNLYKLAMSDAKLQPVFTNDGAYETSLSPDESKLLLRYSFKNKPWELYVADNKKKAIKEQITFSTTPEFNSYAWRAPEVISFKAQDGITVNARLYKPEQNNSNKAAIIFVHGAGYLQNAHNYWSTYHREYMFHNLLTDAGYTVLDIDYRGSDGYGRDFRTGIYRFMGGKDLSDQIDGKKYLVDNLNIDTNRVGIYGGSYGGFITLMGMLTTPGEFKSGAALRSVTDWAHYNHGYTGNILNFPETDPLAYKKSSPIYFADNLKGNLLMLHGMVDNNVEYKDIVRLSQRFIELGKKNWILASFPVEAHGFKETYSWVDEYSRILNLFNTTLLEK